MASKNRTETKTTIDSTFVPTLAIADHRAFLNEQADNLVFRKDVISQETHTSGSKTIDFTDKDLVDITITGNTTFLFSNLLDGDLKYLKVTKSAFNTIAFSGAIKKTVSSPYGLTTVLYKVYRKDGVNYVENFPDRLLSTETNADLTFQNGFGGFIYAFNYLNIFSAVFLNITNNLNSYVAGDVVTIANMSGNSFFQPQMEDVAGIPIATIPLINTTQNKFQGILRINQSTYTFYFDSAYSVNDALSGSGFYLTAGS